MTKEQQDACRKEVFNYSGFLVNKSTVLAFKSGYKAALTPESIKLMTVEQLMENELVKGLVEALEIYMEDPRSLRPIVPAMEALKPFVKEGMK